MQIRFEVKKKLGDFQLDAGGTFSKGITGIFGPSGSGKTILLHCLTGFIRPDQGHVMCQDQTYFSSVDRINLVPEKRPLGLVFQDGLLFPHMTVRQNMLYGARKDLSKKFFEEVMDVLEIFSLLKRSPLNLSGGEKQRVALARTLFHNPSVILMDEPVSSVDLKARQQIILYLKQIHQVFKIPLVYISHSLPEILALADEVYFMREGKNTGCRSAHEASVLQHLNQSSEDVYNIYDLPVDSIHPKKGFAQLDWGGTPLFVAIDMRFIKPHVRISFRAKDILVSKVAVKELSARNVIAATLEQAIPAGGKYILQLKVNSYPCQAEITRAAYEGLDLHSGQELYLIFKARSIAVLE